jgi:hypothetical protein
METRFFQGQEWNLSHAQRTRKVVNKEQLAAVDCVVGGLNDIDTHKELLLIAAT